MNRKPTEDQKNDISIIIGNLPKRLQEKIANETGTSCCFATEQKANDADFRVGPVQGDYCAQKLPKIDFFLSKNAVAATTDNNVAHVAGNQVISKNVVTSPKDIEAVAIPGILRLNQVVTSGPRKESKFDDEKRSPNRCARVNSPMRLRSKHPQPPWFKQLLLKDIDYIQPLPELHDQLFDAMQCTFMLKEEWSKFCEVHAKLQRIFAQLLLKKLKFCCEQKVDTYFWKLLFYNVIEKLKQIQTKSASTHAVSIINHGIDFYTDLLVKLNEKYAPQNEVQHSHKFEFIAKVSAQKLLICLGDLSRYKSKLLHLNDFSASYNFYQSAQKLIPTNGIPYNQLAVLAIYNRKKFDAVYFHMRSLMASNAIYSAKESLLILFDEIRKKYEETEMLMSPMRSNNALNKKSKSMRKEVWIHRDGVRSLHHTDITTKLGALENRQLKELPTDELLRRFTSLYLYVIGKLFTGIGMETIQEHQRKLLLQLRFILKCDPLIISIHRFLQIVALNIFIVEHNKRKDDRREIRHHAFVFCNEFFGLLLRKCNEIFSTNLTRLPLYANDNRCQDLNTILMFVNIWCGWLAKNVQIWEPLRCEEQSVINTWSELELLFENTEKVLSAKEIICEDYADTMLEEYIYLAGFTPVSQTCATLTNDKDDVEKEEQFYLRLAEIAKFRSLFTQHADRLENKNQLDFCLEELNTQLRNAMVDDDEDNNNENIVNNGHFEGSKVNGSNFTSINRSSRIPMLDAQNGQVSELFRLKKELEAKSNVKKMYSAKLEEILKFVDTKLYIEVRPKYLLPDTNCFIDCLEDFEQLVHDYKYYTLMIPLTVVKELDGLSKGVKIESYESSLKKNRIHHFDDVSTRAKKSLDFVKTANNNVKCATSKGSIINASLFALVEEEHVSNDDKILATALALSKTMSTETNKDGKCFIQTELVLITTDRNLRVKALSRNLAVSDLSDFQQWAKECR